jgi:hypothetical protein
MTRVVLAATVLVLASGKAGAGGGLAAFLQELDLQARADVNGFSVKVSAQFGVPLPQVQAVIKTVDRPSDAFMVFQLGQMTEKPPDAVVDVYQANRGKGWGVIAQSLGIKPGSPEFHALKRGDFVLSGEPGAGHGKGKGKGRGK